jgi:hypothetical protein
METPFRKSGRNDAFKSNQWKHHIESQEGMMSSKAINGNTI